MNSLDVWESKADSERFFTERMLPALKEMGLEGGPPLSFREFDLPHVVRHQTATAPTGLLASHAGTAQERDRARVD